MPYQMPHRGGGSSPSPGQGMGGPPPRNGPAPNSSSQTAIPLEKIIADISVMGFERHQVVAVVHQLQANGQAIDLNVILDTLTKGRY
jgi:hypothetical protein